MFIVTIAVGIQDRPAGAPQNTPGPWTSDYKITANPSFADGIAAVSSLVFAFTGTPAFFAIAAEMREPRLYTRAVFICQGLVTAVYLTVGCVVYYYCGSYVASPALGSAGTTIKKVSYGFALPGLIATTTIVTHVCLPSLLLIHICEYLDIDILCIATSKIHLHPPPPQHQTPNNHNANPSHNLANLHLHHRPNRLHHRQRHPRLRQSRLPHRRSSRHLHDVPADGVHVAV